MKVLIVDDEKLPAHFLSDLVKENFNDIVTCDIALSGSEGLLLAEQKNYDVVFLDIEMQDMTGFDWISRLKTIDKPQVIFTTAHSQYAIKAFKVNALDYLLKPIDPSELMLAISKVRNYIQLSNVEDRWLSNKLVVFDGNEYLFLRYDDIIFIEADRSYTKFVVEGKKPFLVSKSIGHFEERLIQSHFIKTHRSYIVNVNCIVSYIKKDGGYVVLSDNSHIPISSANKESIKQLMLV